jgi:hypothetical protein
MLSHDEAAQDILVTLVWRAVASIELAIVRQRADRDVGLTSLLS